jgi:hypothetical protein
MRNCISTPSAGVPLFLGDVVGAVPAAMATVFSETMLKHLDRLIADLATPISLGFFPINLVPFRLREIVRGDLAFDGAIEGETTSLGRNGQTAALAGMRSRAHLRLVEIPARLTPLWPAARLAAGLVKEVATVLTLDGYRYRS